MAEDLDDAGRRLAQPDEIALVRQHAELDDGILRADRWRQGAPHLGRRNASPRRGSRPPARSSSDPLTAESHRTCMSLSPALGEPGRVAQHRREHRGVAWRESPRRGQRQLEAGRGGMVDEVGADGKAGSPARCRTAGGWRVSGWRPALRITSSALEPLTAGRQHPDGPVAFEQHAVHEGVAADVEVGPGAGGLEIGVVGRDSPAVAGGQGDAADAGGARRVVVVLDRDGRGRPVPTAARRRAARGGRAGCGRAGSDRPGRGARRRRSRGRPRPAGSGGAARPSPSPGSRAVPPSGRSPRACRAARRAR